MIINAILKINPNAKVSVIGNDIDTCEITWHENTTPISKEDIKAQIPIVETEIANKETDKQNVKVSGNQKLLDLGLTQAEATALTGYTPPVAE
jgi:hypothetical protein